MECPSCGAQRSRKGQFSSCGIQATIALARRLKLLQPDVKSGLPLRAPEAMAASLPCGASCALRRARRLRNSLPSLQADQAASPAALGGRFRESVKIARLVKHPTMVQRDGARDGEARGDERLRTHLCLSTRA